MEPQVVQDRKVQKVTPELVEQQVPRALPEQPDRRVPKALRARTARASTSATHSIPRRPMRSMML